MYTKLTVDYVIMAINAYCNTETKSIVDKYKFPMPRLRAEFSHSTPIAGLGDNGCVDLIWRQEVRHESFSPKVTSWYPDFCAPNDEYIMIFGHPWKANLRDFLVECDIKGLNVLGHHREEVERLNKYCFAWFQSKTWYHRPPSRNRYFHGWYKGFPYAEPVEVRYEKSGTRYSLPCNWFAEIEKP